MDAWQEIVAAVRAEDLFAPPVFVLVPHEARLDVEEEVLRRAGIPGSTRLRVVGMGGLLREIWRALGSAPPPLWDEKAFALAVAAELAADPTLFAGWPRRLSVARVIAETLWDATVLHPEGQAPFRPDEHRLAQRLLTGGRLHPSQALLLAAEKVKVQPPFPGAFVFRFADEAPEPAAERLLTALAAQGRVVDAPLDDLFPSARPRSVVVHPAHGDAALVSAALRQVLEHIAAGVPADAMLLLVPELARLGPELERQAAALGLPLVLQEAEAAGEGRLQRFLGALLRLAGDPEEPSAWLALAETGLVRPEVRAAAIQLAEAPRLRRRRLLSEPPEPLHRLLARLPRPAEAPAPMLAGRLARFLSTALTREALSPEEREELDALREALWDVTLRLGTRTVRRQEFIGLWEGALGLPEPRRTAPMRGVLVRGLGLVATPPRRVVLVVGAAAGALPPPPPRRGLDDRFRREPGEPGLVLARLTTRAEDLLWLGFSDQDGEGRSAGPALFVTGLLTAGARLERQVGVLAGAATPRDLAREALLLGVPPHDWPAALVPERPRPVPLEDGVPLPAEVRRELLGAPPRLSVSLLESYAGCPFRALAERLGLVTPPEEDELSPARRGELLHRLLARLVSTPDFLEQPAERLAEEAGRAFEDFLAREDVPALTLTGRREAESAVWRRHVGRVVVWLQEELRQSGFRTLGTELPFTIRAEGQDGSAVTLVGRIDRVDGDGRHLRVVDYKSGAVPFKLERVGHGVDLQLLTYLLALAELDLPGEGAGGVYWPLGLPSGRIDDPKDSRHDAFWAMRPRGLYRARQEVLTSLGDERFHRLGLTREGEPKGDGVRDEDFDALLVAARGRLSALGTRLLAGDFAPRPWQDEGGDTPCRTCGLLAVCRHDQEHYRLLPKLGSWADAARALAEDPW